MGFVLLLLPLVLLLCMLLRLLTLSQLAAAVNKVIALVHNDRNEVANNAQTHGHFIKPCDDLL